MNKKENRAKIYRILTYIILILLAVISIIPFYNMIIGCTHDNAALSTSFQIFPGSHLLDNYLRLQDNVNIWRGLGNSVFLSVMYTMISTYIGALTAYGFAKYRFRGNKVLFWIVLATMMLPGQLGIIGYFQEMNELKLLDNYIALLMPSFATPVMVYWIRQYIDAYVPNELLESARMDGCNEFMIFNRIIFPVIIPGVATQAIFTFVSCWNSYVQPSILLFSQNKFTLPILVQQMQGVYKTDYGVIYLGVTLSVIPILMLFIFCSKMILKSTMAGAVKG